jgi:hypothetical protein
LVPFKEEKADSGETKEVFGSLQRGKSWLKGNKRSLWFPSKGKKLIQGNQKVFGSLEKGKSSRCRIESNHTCS